MLGKDTTIVLDNGISRKVTGTQQREDLMMRTGWLNYVVAYKRFRDYVPPQYEGP
jgi:hypothetical protein